VVLYFFGIADDGIVQGQKSMTREKRDWIQTGITNRLASWKVIKPDNTTCNVPVKFDFVEVIRLDESKQFGRVIPDLCVIRINIKPQFHPSTHDQLVFATFDKCVWIRKLATVARCRESDILLSKAEGYEVDEKTGVNNFEDIPLKKRLILDDLNGSLENPGSMIPRSTIITDENKINDNGSDEEELYKKEILRELLWKLRKDLIAQNNNTLEIDDEYVNDLLSAHNYNVDAVAQIIQQQIELQKLYGNAKKDQKEEEKKEEEKKEEKKEETEKKEKEEKKEEKVRDNNNVNTCYYCKADQCKDWTHFKLTLAHILSKMF